MARLIYDNKVTNMMFVDKVNKHYAEDKDIIKFVLKKEKGDNKRFAVSSFIGKSHGLNGITLEMYCIAATYYDNNSFTIAGLLNTYKRIYGVRGRNGSWYNAINNLIDKNIVYKDENNRYVLYSFYRLPKNCEDRKFLIIELDEETTSAPITI